MVDENGRFKLSPMTTPGQNAKFTLHPKSNNPSANIIVELNPAEETSSADTSSGSESGNTKKITANMLKVNGQWRLQKLVY